LIGAVVVAAVAAAATIAIGFGLSWLGDRELRAEDRRRVVGFLPLVVVPAVVVYLSATILNDPLDAQMIITFIFVAGAVVTEMILGFLIALMMHRELRGRGVLRAIITLPIFATPIALGYLARAIFYEQGGPINAALSTVGLGQPPGSRIRNGRGWRRFWSTSGSGPRSCSSSPWPGSKGCRRTCWKRRRSTAPAAGSSSGRSRYR
jgi:ABC-type sugar transport system permease subunit